MNLTGDARNLKSKNQTKLHHMKPEILEQVRQMIRTRKLGGPSAIGADLPWSCDEIPPELFYIGLEQFNRGEYFEQHESLEEIWVVEPRPIRYVYQAYSASA